MLSRKYIACLTVALLGWNAMAAAVDLPQTEEEKKKLSGREVTILRRQMKARENEAFAAYKNAETAFLVGEYDKAIEEYLNVAREYDDTSFRMRAVLRIGDVYYRQKKYERAVSYYQRALQVPSELWWPEESAEDYARADYMIGVCYFDQDALNQAFAHFRRFVQKFPESRFVDRAYDFIGRGNMEMKRYGQAIEAFRMVGTANIGKQARRTISPGENLYVRVTDADVGLATKGSKLEIKLTTSGGDEEYLALEPLGIGSPVFLGTIKTRLGTPRLTQALEQAFPREKRLNIDTLIEKADVLDEEAKRLQADLNETPEPAAQPDAADAEAVRKANELRQKRNRLQQQINELAQTGANLREEAYQTLDTAFAAVEKLLADWGVKLSSQRIANIEATTAENGVSAQEGQSGENGQNEQENVPADQLSDVFTPEQIANVREAVRENPTGPDTLRYRKAVLEYWHEQLLEEYKTLDLNGADTIQVHYLDSHGSDKDEIARTDELGVAADATVVCVSQDMNSIVRAVILGDDVRIKLTDADMDRTDQPDTVSVTVSSLPKTPEKEDLADEDQEEDGDDNDDELSDDNQSVSLFQEPEEEQKVPELVPKDAPSITIMLTETGNHTGVFLGSFATIGETEDSPAVKLALSPERKVRAAYKDERNASHPGEWVAVYEVGIVLGSEGEHEVIEMQESKLDRRSELEKGIALGQLARVYQDLGLRADAQHTFDEALKVVRKVVDAEGDSPLGEEATYQMWDLYFASGNEEAAAEACAKLIAAFPQSALADDALLIMGKAEKRDRHRAVQHFSRLVSQYPDSPLAPEAQYLIAETKAKNNQIDVAAYEACANKYPQSNFAAESLLKLAEYYMDERDYGRALDYLERITLDFPDFDKLDKATFMRGVSVYRTGDMQLAYTLMHEVIEKYPGTASAEAAAKIVQLLAKKLKE